MTQLETAMAMLMKTFDTYAAGEGSKDTLSKAEVKTLLEKELPGLLKVPYTELCCTEWDVLRYLLPPAQSDFFFKHC